MSLFIDTIRDFDSGITTVQMDGELTFATAPIVRSALAKSASECPTAVIVNLDALQVSNLDLVVLFPAAAQRASTQWGVPLVLCCARPDVAARISLFRTFTEVYDNAGSAIEAVRGGVPRRRREHFSPVPGSVALACHLVAQVCTDWNLAHLRVAAVSIVSELANNAIEHAGTAFDVTVSHSSAYLRIAVQDGGPALPPWIPDQAKPAARDRGLGLYVVDALATAWNTTGVADGKIVWALLRACPPGSPRGTHHLASQPPQPRTMDEILADVGSHHDSPTSTHATSPRELPTAEDLSDREMEVLVYLTTMLTATEIGIEMHVSVNTVKAHMRSIYHKLDVSRRQDAVSRAYESGLLP